jgi:Uma2 family endonuclease
MTLTSIATDIEEISPIVLRLPDSIEMDSDHFFDFCQLNGDLRIERAATGEMIIMPPTGGETRRRNFNLLGELFIWTKQDGTGIGFDSSTGFTLPSGAIRSPDVAWIKKERWEALEPEKRQKFPPICPDFVIELKSATDSLKTLQEKMREYIENGVLLGFLLDSEGKQAYIYRQNVEVERVDNPETLSGEPILKGFTLDLKQIW